MTTYWVSEHYRWKNGNVETVSGHYRTRVSWQGYQSHRLAFAKQIAELGRDSAEKYLVPNATCPECGDSVYFYRNEYGGCAWFDSLGHPWPIHSCMEKEVSRCSPEALPSLTKKRQPLILNEKQQRTTRKRIIVEKKKRRLVGQSPKQIKKGQPRAWQRMLSGRRLDLLDPSPFDIEIEDIAHGLARVARWNGQTSGDHAFSVAEHSVVVEKLFSILNPKVSREDKLVALLHDAAEYVVGDMISPFKAALGIDYTDFEDRIEQAVHLRFGLPPQPRKPLKKAIKTCDIYCAYFEAIQIAGFTTEEANQFFTKPPGDIRIEIAPLSVIDAKYLYLKRFAELS